MKKKIKYQKPECIDIGKPGSVLGASCSVGDNADDGCPMGNNPNVIRYCDGGSTADGNCLSGGVAGQYCGAGDSATYN